MRERGEDNSFNVLEVDGHVFTVKRFHCGLSETGFRLATIERFANPDLGWARM
jgi:hypothetical protein